MNNPSYTVLDLAQFSHWPDAIHQQARALLVAAQALIQRGWCRDHRALSAQGKPVAPDDEDAAYFSLSGSLIAHRELNAHAIHPDALYAALMAIYHTLDDKPPQSTDPLCQRVEAFNDQAQDRDEVIDRLRQALLGYDALVRGDGRFCPPQYPKADGEALHYYIERVRQGVIPCSQARTR